MLDIELITLIQTFECSKQQNAKRFNGRPF